MVFRRKDCSLLRLPVLVLLMCPFLPSLLCWAVTYPQCTQHPFSPVTSVFFCCLKTSCQQYTFFSAGDSGHPNQPSDQWPPTLLCHHCHRYQTGKNVSLGRGRCSLGHVMEKMMSMFLNMLRSHQNGLVGLVNPSQKVRDIYWCFSREAACWVLLLVSHFGNIKHLCMYCCK